MASKNIIIAAVVVVIAVIAAAVIITGNNDNNDYRPDDVGLKQIPAVNDSYTLSETTGTLGAEGDTVTYTVTSVEGTGLYVEITHNYSDGTSETESKRMTVEQYYENVYYYVDKDDRRDVRTIQTAFGEKQVYVIRDGDTSGASRFDTVDYVGVGSYIVYRSEITITSMGVSETIVRELTSGSVIVDGGDVIVPSEPSSGNGSVSSTVVVGDYIQWYVEDKDDRENYDLKLTVLSVEGDRVTYREDEGRWDSDTERTTVQGFINRVAFKPSSWMADSGVEKISLEDFGTVECRKYVLADGRDDRTEYYVGTSDGVLYRTVEYDDGRVEEIVTLRATSLLGGSSSEPSEPLPETPANRYGIELSVGDSYTIEESEGRKTETKTYTIVAISGNRLTVEERDNKGKVEYEKESAESFLEEVFMIPSAIAGITSSCSGTATVDGIQYSYSSYVFTERDGDTDEYWVSSDYGIILKHISSEKDDRDVETEMLMSITIASLGI